MSSALTDDYQYPTEEKIKVNQFIAEARDSLKSGLG